MGVAMRFRVLGTVEASGRDGVPVVLGDRRRALLASLLARAGDVVSADHLALLLWGDDPPGDAASALHNQVSRLRRALPDAQLLTTPPGYTLRVDPDILDASRFDRLVAAAEGSGGDVAAGLLREALDLWRGPAYAEFADTDIARFEAIRLEQARLHAVEGWHRALLACGRAAESLPALEAFVSEHPLREQARAVLMKVLYALGRHAEALRAYQQYCERLADELGLEPSAAMQDLRLRILRQELPVPGGPSESVVKRTGPARPAPLAGLTARYITAPGGRTIAVATLGTGPPLVVLPGWVSSIEVIGSGRDPRSSVLQRLVEGCTLALYDRYGTGLSRGAVDDFGLEPSVDELEAVARHVGPPVSLLAMSQAGPVAVALAARRPELVDRLVFLGTYASAGSAFTRPELNAALVAMIRSHWGLGSKLLANLYRPDATDHAARHLAEVLRDCADRDIAANYLEAVYHADVAELLPTVAAPALVLHYRGDRVVPFIGGQQLAMGLHNARLMPLDGPYHLPDAADLDRIVSAVQDFLHAPRL